MAQMRIPAARKVYTKKYATFRGVDFSTDPAMVDETRSPDAKNIISDAGGYPEKRIGWETKATFEGHINGLFSLYADGEITVFVHHGTKLSTLDGVLIASDMNDHDSTGFVYEGKLYLLDGAKYRVVERRYLQTVPPSTQWVIDVPQGFTPTTIVGASPAGDGKALEAVNLISARRKNSFYGDGSSKTFRLDASHLDSAAVYATVDGVESFEGDSSFTVDRTAGTVTFVHAPSDSGGVDNVVIEFSRTIEGNADVINKCTFATWYGMGNDSRVFVSGNPDHPNMDWNSGLYDPTYFPDTGYTKFGTDSSRIMGYLKQYDNLLVVKEDNDQDATIFMRSAEIDSNGTAYFPVFQGVSGVGAIAMKSFGALNDDPLFLAKEGVFSPVLTYGVKQERTMQNRSYFIDARLTKEEGLENACSVSWNGFYLLCVNGNCYVADQRQKSKGNSTSSYSYEWFFWDNIPARTFLELDGSLYFGTEDGRVCRFKTDVVNSSRYNDDSMPIDAVWSTKMDDDGDFMLQKTIPKKGSGIMIKPYSRSGIDIYVRTNKDLGRKARTATMDVFDFNDIDFSRLTFETNDSPKIVPINMKVKKYSSMQIMMRNNALNEGFGVYGVVKRYYVGNYMK